MAKKNLLTPSYVLGSYLMSYPTINNVRFNFPNGITSSMLNNAANYLGPSAFVKSKYSGCFASSTIHGNNIIGIDLPVLIGNNQYPVIFIIGESALRKNKNFVNNNLLIGTPFAVVGQLGIPSQCDVYKKIFGKLLRKQISGKNYSLYITDVVKIWSDNQTIVGSWEQNNSKNVIIDELNIIKPDYIVTLGAKARDVVIKNNLNNLNGKIPLIQLIHPSKQAWDNWKIEMYKDILCAMKKGMNPNTCFAYKHINNTNGEIQLDDDILSDYAVSLIP